MYLETMQQIFSNTTKVMVDAKNGSNLLYLPLDKLIAQTAANDASNAKSVPGGATMAPTPAPDTMQSLDNQRPKDARGRDSRDRETR